MSKLTIQWSRSRDGYVTSRDERFRISPEYMGTSSVQGYRINDSKTGKHWWADTQKIAKLDALKLVAQELRDEAAAQQRALDSLRQAGQKKFPAVAPTIKVGDLTLTLMHDMDRFSNGHLVMKIADCDAEMFRGKKSIGHIGTAMGATMYVEIGGRLWKFDKLELFAAAERAEREQYLAKEKT